MKKRVRIVKAPMLPQAQNGMSVGPTNGQMPPFNAQAFFPADTGSKESLKVNNTLQPTDPAHATLEAEKGETVVTNLDKAGIPELYTVGGKRHSQGGTPLNLPKDSFVFSRDRKMKIKDPDILAQFGKTVGKKGKKGFTPADISKQYNLNKYRQILADPDSSRRQRDTAEMMIENYNLKLGGLAMVQESMKGFENGIPGIAMPYLEQLGIDPAALVEPPQMEPNQEQAAQQQQGPPQHQMPDGSMMDGAQHQARYGGAPNAAAIKKIEPLSNVNYFQTGGQTGGNGLPEGAVVRKTPDGRYEVLGPDGKVIGQVNAPFGTNQNASPYYDANGNPITNQNQTVYNTSTRTTKTQNIPSDAVKWDETADGYDESQMQAGDYVKKADGKWHKVTGEKIKKTPYTGSYENPNLVGNVNGEERDLQEAYGRLNETIMGDPDLQKAIISEYHKNMDSAKPNSKTGLSEEDLKKAREMSDEDILSNFFAMEEQVMAVNAQGITAGSDWDEKDSWDKDRANYTNTVSGMGFTALEPWQQAAFQGTYIGLQNMADNPEYKDKLKDFNVSQVGRGDEAGGGTGKSTISDIDGWVGNTTIGQAAMYKPTEKEIEMQEADWTEEEHKEVKHLAQQEVQQNAPWWLQDQIKVAGAAGDLMRVKKHMPWQATPGMKLADPTFLDPTRQLAANAELANIATQGAATFAGPQAFNARAAQIQGKAATNVANTLAQVQGQNVQVANQFEMANAQIMNKASDRKAQLNTQLFDKNTIANQQFENAKNQARQQLRQGYIDGITNRAQAQTMNQLYPQYNVDPSSGGMMNFTQGRDLKPTQPNTTGVADQAIGIQRQNPGMTYDEALKYANANAGVAQGPPANSNYMNPSQFAYPGGMG
jgi:hypothetical protein